MNIWGVETTPAGTPAGTWDYMKDWPADGDVDPNEVNTSRWETRWFFVEVHWPWDGGWTHGRRRSIGVDVGLYLRRWMYAISLEGRRSRLYTGEEMRSAIHQALREP